jgi:hypothetical protein
VLHGAYQVREILTAFGFLTADRYTPFQTGVLALRDRSTELLFVTLDKSSDLPRADLLPRLRHQPDPLTLADAEPGIAGDSTSLEKLTPAAAFAQRTH